MADRDWNGLPYGHFGTAVYEPRERTWRFEKVPDQPRTLELIGDPEIIVPPSLSSGISTTPLRDFEPPHIRREKQFKDLVKSHPVTQAATSNLRPLLHASEAVEAATQRHDPVKGSLLSFGRIFDVQTRRSTQVAAFASGLTGSDVRVVQLQVQKQGWDDSRDIWLEMPVISGEEALWSSGGSPVLQVNFAQPLENGENLLVIRTSDRTMIFKPVLRKAGPGRLHLKLLLELATGDNDHIPHADVAFNPWFPRQFSIVDQSARWRIWEFRTRQSSEVTCVCSSVNDEDDSSKATLNDGWTRSIWVCNPSTILIVTRSAVKLYDIASGPSKLQDVDINVSDVSSWVLDVAGVLSDPNRVLVLTTTHIHLVCAEDRNGEVHARSMMRIRHFRSPQDITLRFTAFRDEEAVTVTLRSALSPTLTTYRLTLDESRMPTLHDPTHFELDLGIVGDAASTKLLEFNIQNISTGNKRSANFDHALVERLRENDCRFISVITLNRDLSMSRWLYMDHPSSQRSVQMIKPSWFGKVLGSSSKVKEDFIVDDHALSDDIAGHANEPVARYVGQRRQHAKCLIGHEWTVNHEWTSNRVGQRAMQTESVDNILTEVRELLEQPPEPGFTPMRSLLELSDGEVTMSDMDQASAQLEQLSLIKLEQSSQLPDHADGAEQSTRFVIRRIDSEPLLGLQSPQQNLGAALTSTYGSIVSHWISPLSNAVPGRVRLAKDQLARRLAVEITLASQVFQIEDIEDHPESQQDAKPVVQSQSLDHPMRDAEASQATQFSNSQSVLPTPSPTGTPSVTTASSRTSAFSSAEVSRLKRYTTFTKPAPSSLPRSLNKILAHWTPGTDPSAYDWVTTSRQISQQTREEEVDSQLTEKQRARLHRKAERHIRRQRKEAEASQSQFLASSQMPELVVSGSGYGANQSLPQVQSQSQSQSAPGFGFGSSQVVGGALPLPNSQAVKGRFGGRAAMPVRKKRKQGF